MNLTDDQKSAVSQWIAEGVLLSDIQSRLRTEFSVTITYMEARLLMAELNLTPVEKKRDEPKPEVVPEKPEGEPGDEADLMDEDSLPPGAGGVTVSIDQITRPNAMVSGKVTFSDGNTAEWFLDSTGRLGLNPTVEGYRPTQADVAAFQMELQRMASSQGF